MQHHELSCLGILDQAARWHPEQTVVSKEVHGELTRTTYAQLHTRAQLCCSALRQLGVRPGDRVGTLAFNTVRHLEAWYGIMGAGAICHTLNPRLFPKDLTTIISHDKGIPAQAGDTLQLTAGVACDAAGTSILLFDACFAALAAQLRPSVPSIRHFVVLTSRQHAGQALQLGFEVLVYDDLLAAEAPLSHSFRWAPVREDDPCGLCFTSGTTSTPKGVLYTHRANVLHAFEVCLPDGGCLSAASVVLVIVPLFHANSWGLAFAGPLVGARLVLPGPQLDGESVHALLCAERATLCAAVPTVISGLVQHARATGRGLAALRICMVGGAPCPPSLLADLEGTFGVEVRHLWGMTELCPMGTVAGLKEPVARMPKAQQTKVKLKQGRPVPLVDMRITDDDGRELPRDGKAFGELQVRGHHVISRYYKAEQAATDDQGWFSTGDVATIDPLGHMEITDRSKDVIKSGGEWISSIEIEGAAQSHPQVTEAACIAVPHPKWSERPLLVCTVDLREPPTPEAILQFLEGKVAKWWLPDGVVFVSELPHTATGKLNKRALRERFRHHRPPPRARL